jgi:hypothetical protein
VDLCYCQKKIASALFIKVNARYLKYLVVLSSGINLDYTVCLASSALDEKLALTQTKPTIDKLYLGLCKMDIVDITLSYLPQLVIKIWCRLGYQYQYQKNWVLVRYSLFVG